MKDIGSYGMDVAWTRGQSWAVVLVLVLLFVRNGYGARSHTVQHDIPKATVTMADGQSNLVLRLNLNDRCVIDRMIVRGRDVGAPGLAAYTGVCVSNQWHTSSALTSKPVLKLTRNKVTVSGIRADCGGIEFSESWQFTLLEDRIVWEITRTGAKEVLVDDAGLPVLQFQNMQTWAGAMLDHGGVAWNRYLETPNASYASDTAEATFWNREHKDCLRVRTEGRFAPTAVAQGKAFRRNPAEGGRPLNVSTRFSHQPSKLHTAVFSLSQAPFRPRHGQHRFHASRQDVWAPVRVPAGTTVATVSFQALDYEAAYDRGSFAGLNGGNIRELMNTIGRYGVIDRRLVGANGWRTGFICLHEQWFSQMGIALADLAYIQNCAATYDYERDHAILENGRVKARWYYGVGDAMPGTYDSRGFYEAQWGYLMDSQPCYAICVAEQFDLTGDLAWLASHKAAGERALAYLMRRDTDADGLVEMMNQSHADQRGSDWIDIIWAAHENALVNAEFYHALMRWTELETILGDTNRAVEYATFAGRLKASFNQTVDEGGFWDPQNGWYTYWRDKDGSIHGNNLVTPVNFAAISYGLCDVPARRDSLLSKIESLMQKEGLFFWPLNFFPFPREEGHANNFPYPNYENGDIFLSWGELATRAYAQVDAGIALKYVKNVLAKYEIDGLSHQRYQRQSQIGIGEDILAGNCMTIVGLYRNIYGIQPKHNRLYLEPHLPAELNGTRLNYPLRGQRYEIELSAGAFAMTANGCTIRYHQPFAINTVDDGVEFFPGSASCPGLVARPSRSAAVEVTIHAWPVQSDKPRIWQLASPQGNSVTASICNLLPGADYVIECNGKLLRRLRADAAGAVTCKLQAPRTTDSFVLRLVTGEKRF